MSLLQVSSWNACGPRHVALTTDESLMARVVNPIVVKDNFAGVLMVGSLITAMLVNDIVLISTKMLIFTVRAVEKSLWLRK